jgi:hypothetical protein
LIQVNIDPRVADELVPVIALRAIPNCGEASNRGNVNELRGARRRGLILIITRRS